MGFPDPKIFKDYDIRGTYPEQIDKGLAVKLGRILVRFFNVNKIAVGRDARLSSSELFAGLVEGIASSGCDVIDLGIISTDMAWFASGKYNFPLTVMITASHNPPEFNGFKMATAGANAVSGETGIYHIRDLLLKEELVANNSSRIGQTIQQDILNDWIVHLLKFVDVKEINNLKVVVDAGNGVAGIATTELFRKLDVQLIPLYFKPDGSFPNHPADPMNEKNIEILKRTVIDQGASFGAAFDGDGDRVLFVDEKGKTISGTVTTALIAKNLLEKHKGELILYNAIIGRVVPELIKKLGGRGMRVRVGHSIIKNVMREHNALFCGEHSYHFFFRDNYYADSGLITLLLILELVATSGKKVSEMVGEFDIYFASGEINFKTENKEKMLSEVKTKFTDAPAMDELDGISVWYPDWWFNVRPSNTENLIRLNIETDTKELLRDKQTELTELIKKLGGIRAE